MSEQNLMPQMSEKFEIVLSQLMLAKISIGSIKKDSNNPHFKSKYASLNAYIDSSERSLTEHGLILITAGNGSFREPMIIATLVHPESGQWIKSYLPILNPKQDSQGLGAAVTYMRRYSIATLLGLTSEDDDGETAVGRGQYEKKAQLISANQIKNMQSMLEEFPSEKKKMETYLVRKNITFERIPADVAQQTLEKLLALKEEKEANVEIEYISSEDALKLDSELHDFTAYSKQVYSLLDRRGITLDKLTKEESDKIFARLAKLKAGKQNV